MQKKINSIPAIGIIALCAFLAGTAIALTALQIKNIKFIPPECVKTEAQDETAGWQTYQNEVYGFEIKYPMDWYTETEISSGWSEKGGPGITIIFGNYSSDKESLKLDQRDVIIIGVGETLINEYEKIRIGRHRGFVFG